jgi:pantothenate kinase
MSTSASSIEQHTLQAHTQEEAYDQLADRVLSLSNPASRYMVAIAGVPGSGKSTAAAEVSRRLNERREGTAQPDGCQVPCAIAVPMDGFHYYRRELDAMPDAESLHARRGSHWTFNAHAFVAAMHRVRTRNEVLLPSFQHGVGDPVEDNIVVATHHTLVLVEGNYLLIDEPPWHELADLFDDTWYIDCDVDVAMERVYARQVGDGRLPDVVQGRIAGNDRPNADFIAAVSRHRAAVLVPSLPFAHSK